MKTCTVCKKSKELRGFYQKSDGCPMEKCMECHRACMRSYYAKSREKIRAKNQAVALKRKEMRTL